MKSIFSALLSLSASAFALTASAQINWIFDSERYNSTVNWSQSFGTAGESDSGYWYYLDDDGSTRHYIAGGTISSSDSITVDSTLSESNILIRLDTDVSLANINILGDKNVNLEGTANTNKLTVSGTITNENKNTNGINFNQVDLSAESIYAVGSNIFSNNLYRVHLNSFTDKDGTNRRYNVAANGSVMERAAAGTDTFENGIANPDIYIGYVSCDGVFFNNISNQSTDLYYEFGGLNGTSGITSNATNSNYTTNVILSNTNVDTAYTATYGMREYNGGPNSIITSIQKIRLVMKGTDGAIQNFHCPDWTDCQMLISGGVTMMSGTLRINFNQKVSSYTYKTDANTRVYWTVADNASAARTTFSHGDLIMQGGEFGSYVDSSSYGSFRFTNIRYSGGTITLRLDGADRMDSIDLTSYYKATAEITDATGNVNTETLGNVVYEKVDGGTITREEGAGKITFNFTGDLLWLVDYEAGGKQGVRVIAWDAAPDALTSDDFTANAFTSGDDYIAKFALYDDGLYVYYTAVPEPAELAALFGLLALGFAAWRRRRAGR